MDYGMVVMKLIRQGGKYHPLFNSDSEDGEKRPSTITKALGEPADRIV